MAVYLLALEGVKNFSQDFVNLEVGVPVAERIG